MDESIRPPSATDSDPHTDRSTGKEQREPREAHARPAAATAALPAGTAPGAPADAAADVAAPGSGHPAAHPAHDREDPARRREDATDDAEGPRPEGPSPEDRRPQGRRPEDPLPEDPAPQGRRPGSRGPDAGVAAVLRLAVLCVDPDGRISYWNRGAEELFGHRWEHVFGQRASGLLTALQPVSTRGRRPAVPRHDTLDLLDDLTDPAWAGALAATDRDGTLRDVLWWTYRLVEPGGSSLLAIAAHAKPLRTGSLRIALGGRMLPYVPEGPQRQDIAVAAVLAPAPDVRAPDASGPDAPGRAAAPGPATDHGRPTDARTAADADAERAYAAAARLRDVLPGARQGRQDRIVSRIAALGHPALEIDAGTRLPVLPHDYVRAAAAERAERAARRELLPGPRADRRTVGTPATTAPGTAAGTGHAAPDAPATPGASGAPGHTPATPGTTPAAPGHTPTAPADLSSASALTAVPAPNIAPFLKPLDPQFPGAGPAPGAGFTTAAGTVPLPGGPGTIGPGAPRRPADPAGPNSATGPTAPADPTAPTTRTEPTSRTDPADPPQGPVIRATGTALDEQLDLLRRTGAVVGSTLDLHTTARELCAVTVPRFADFAAVLVVDQLFSDTEPPMDDKPGDTVLIRRVAIARQELPHEWETALPEGELLTLPAGGIVPALGEPVLVPVVDPALASDIALDLGVPTLGPLLAGHSLIVAPLTARGTVLGRVAFVRGPGRRPFDPRDAATAAEVTARGAVHIDNARLHRQESRAAATLQRSMMPTRPPRLPGVRIAHHYMPGDRQAQVGGDWFDAIQLPGGRVALIVGDVMGHGLQAAAVMGQFRTAVITMAALDLPPAQLLRHLDNLAHRLGTEHLATCVYAVYDPIERTLTLANAGHIPPVLAGYDGHSELLQIPGGAPIGVGGVPFETVEIPVPDGSWLVLCTDGLVEVRGQGIDAGLAALCSHVIEPEQTPEDVCGQILARVHSEDRTDDVALLVARFEGIAPEDVVRWTLRLDQAEVASARRLTRGQLAAWGLERLAETAELLVSELVTNAIRAASHVVELRMMRVGKLLVEVSDDNHNLPQLQRADGDDETGRGLALVSHLSRRWGTSREAVGKVVWFELPLPTG